MSAPAVRKAATARGSPSLLAIASRRARAKWAMVTASPACARVAKVPIVWCTRRNPTYPFQAP